MKKEKENVRQSRTGRSASLAVTWDKDERPIKMAAG